ncbi:TPA: hypothetical protein ACNRRD_006551 [Pseudomonas aeruginosa]|uniref:Uncharacterized protein n=2 Tax=root TaxID=1 RepID=A0A9E7CCK5_9CAUD|nr:hypothetical protein [Pseudomonas aeruginosa]YP_010773359.1 hypothetical protein QIT84_gp066 [Pseudomonas phage PP9W2]ETD94754.1 hypothetical protein V527_01750 [Pseudomonas aeruginosa VRFPA06]MBO8290087.1 hypothetical protein [Pseudomonas aeruginosa]MDG3612422.1 hypothetical protein [Pseudomonas aeruginosa]MDG3612835.1 hypothetical protein [Pseudomonas aeruginosa]MDG3664289.1 hypothetical protein [Pseudomonas aeruginosa]
MSIDWNTAPEGATHWEPRGIVFGEGWMKKVGNEWSYWLEGSEVWAGVWADCFVSAEREATFEARPQEAWDGQGLPPVGTVCQYRHMIWPEYRPCEIRYISEESLVAYDDAQEQLYRTCDMLFRPIRTPEQIAAEEREKAVGDMAMSIQGVPYQYPTLYALYDAGYRRQESST